MNLQSRAKHIALRIVLERKLAEEGKINIHYVKIKHQLVDSGTKHLSKHRHHDLIKLINEFKAYNANSYD